ncbi:MAG: CBS domain-containing protein [Desulfobulbaceae bacterium]
MKKRQLKDILTAAVISVTQDTLISEALGLMRHRNISCIIVLDKDRPVGIVTERNLVRLSARQRGDIEGCAVREVMSTPVITAHQNIDIFEAYSILSSHSMRHLVVVDDTDQLVGVVTLSDIVEHLSYESFVEMKIIAQVMTRTVCTVGRDTPVAQALHEMADKSMSCIVVTEGQRPVGILTERDVSRLLLDYPDFSAVAVDEVMTRSLHVVTGDTPLPIAINVMKNKRLRRLVVVDEGGNIEGLATQSDIVKGLEGKYIQALNEIIREKDFVIRDTAKDLAMKTAYLDSLFQSSMEYGIIVVDLAHRISYFNPGAEQIFALRAREVQGSDVQSLHGHDQRLVGRVNEVLELIGSGERCSFVIERRLAERCQYVNASASGIIDRQKNLIGYFLMINDITESKQAQDSLRSAHAELEKRVEERTRELARAVRGTIEAIALTVEMRDPYTSGHQKRVADLSAAIAVQMGFSKDRVEGVYMAGLLHDIGKIRVPSGILCHPGRLSDAEFAIIKPHPEIGYNILKEIEFPWPLAEIVLQHHERLDGSGYPKGLRGDQIHIKARILAVADVVEALSSHRPYRPALGVDYALAVIAEQRGLLFDPEAVDACLAIFRESGYSLQPHFQEQARR